MLNFNKIEVYIGGQWWSAFTPTYVPVHESRY